MRRTALLIALLVSAPLAAGETASIGDLAWMAGSWTGEGLGGRVEEHWSAPDGGSLIGMFRLVGTDGKTKVTEFMLVEQEKGSVKYRFRHYGSGHAPWETEAPLEFDLVESGQRKAVFESSKQAKPKRLSYNREGATLSITVQNENEGRLDEGFTLRLTRSGE